jgi:hypothetical protein
MVTSSFDTVGIMFADIVCYLVGRVDTISHDAELFRGLSDEQFERNGKIRKLRSSTQLISKVKHLDIYRHTRSGQSAA